MRNDMGVNLAGLALIGIFVVLIIALLNGWG